MNHKNGRESETYLSIEYLRVSNIDNIGSASRYFDIGDIYSSQNKKGMTVKQTFCATICSANNANNPNLHSPANNASSDAETFYPRLMVKVEKYHLELEPLGLTNLPSVKKFQGDLVKNHKGRRDIFRVPLQNADGITILFLKRNWRPYKKDGLASFFKNGRVISLARQEWENSRALEKAGFRPAPLVAVGEECSLLWEKFSFLITASASGEPVDSFLRKCQNKVERRRVLDALALEIQRLHRAGFASPDLFLRHIFVETGTPPPQFCYIDMARLDRVKKISPEMRARDLAALNITTPHRFASAKERIRFLKIYQGNLDKRLFRLIRKRVEQLLTRKKYRRFYATE